jgi:hypothetical protein
MFCSMDLPFTRDAFFDVFARYNLAVWPAQYFLLALGVTVPLTLIGRRRFVTISGTVLGILWMWAAIVYFTMFFSQVTPVAYAYALAFVVEALLIVQWSASGLTPHVSSMAERWVAIAAMTYALLLYPVIGLLAGHRYPFNVSFGLPCPLVILTFGAFALFGGSLPKRLLVVPVLWSMISMSAALQLGVPQDLGLPVAALATIALVAGRPVVTRGTRAA